MSAKLWSWPRPLLLSNSAMESTGVNYFGSIHRSPPVRFCSPYSCCYLQRKTETHSEFNTSQYRRWSQIWLDHRITVRGRTHEQCRPSPVGTDAVPLYSWPTHAVYPLPTTLLVSFARSAHSSLHCRCSAHPYPVFCCFVSSRVSHALPFPTFIHPDNAGHRRLLLLLRA